ncbi:MAG: LptA/OstA family protein [Janthinobacterium lividum]
MSRDHTTRLPAVLLAAALAAAPLAAHHARAQAIDLSHGGPVSVTARDGIDWNQGAQIVTARGDARAIRGDVTVTADELVAHYRKKAAAPGAKPAAPKPAGPAPVAFDPSPPGATPAASDPAAVPDPAVAAPKPTTPGLGDDAGANEIFRLEARGHVHIFTATDQAWGDHATYDIDQAVLVLTGSGLKLVTPQDVLTARDAMEYWSARHMAVGRGDAVVTTNDSRRVQADVLVGYTADPNAPAPAAGSIVPRTKAPDPAKPGADPVASSGKLQRVDGFGHVRVQTPTEVVTGDKGVYVPDTGIARIVGSVHITRGENVLNGAAAIVNMHTGLATLSQNPGARVEGLIVPSGPGAGPGAPGGKPAAKPARAGAPSGAPSAAAAAPPAATLAGATP